VVWFSFGGGGGWLGDGCGAGDVGFGGAALRAHTSLHTNPHKKTSPPPSQHRVSPISTSPRSAASRKQPAESQRPSSPSLAAASAATTAASTTTTSTSTTTAMFLFRHSYIPPPGIQGLAQYKYVAGAYSVLDNLLNPFWYACSDALPLWLAPNLITLIGTFFLLSMGVVLHLLDPLLQGRAPWPAYVWFAVCVWMYQTLDAVDGKQARRTNSSSPLGQLFDHGCDALGTMPLSMILISALGLGPSPMAVALVATIQLPFFMAQFEEHYAHSMRTQVGYFGVTEGQYLEMVVMLVTAGMGTEFWSLEVPADMIPFGGLGVPVTLRHIFVAAGCFFPVLLALASALAVAQTPASPGAFAKLVPVYSCFAVLLWVSARQGNALHAVFSRHPVLFFAVFGCFFAHLVNRVIISSVCKISFPSVEWTIMLPVPLLLAMSQVMPNRVSAALALYACVVCGQYFHFALCVCNQIATFLQINVLTLGKRRA
jgi:ethanolaminephosphotransferase